MDVRHKCPDCGEMLPENFWHAHGTGPLEASCAIEKLQKERDALLLQIERLQKERSAVTPDTDGKWVPYAQVQKCNEERDAALRLNDELKALLVYVVDKSPSVTLVWKERLAAVDVSSVEIIKEPAGTDSYFTLKLKGHVGKSCYGHAQDSCKEQQTEKRIDLSDTHPIKGIPPKIG